MTWHAYAIIHTRILYYGIEMKDEGHRQAQPEVRECYLAINNEREINAPISMIRIRITPKFVRFRLQFLSLKTIVNKNE